MRRRRAGRHSRLRVAKPGERGLQVGIGRGIAMQLQLGQDAIKPRAPDLGPLLDLLEQLFQRSRSGVIAVAPPLRPKLRLNGNPLDSVRNRLPSR